MLLGWSRQQMREAMAGQEVEVSTVCSGKVIARDELMALFRSSTTGTPENSVTADMDAVDALARMHKSGASHLLVMDGDRLVGLLTLQDLLRFLALKLELEVEDRKAEQVLQIVHRHGEARG